MVSCLRVGHPFLGTMPNLGTFNNITTRVKKETKKRRRIKQQQTPSPSHANEDGEHIQYVEEDDHHLGLGLVTSGDPHQIHIDGELGDKIESIN